MILSSISANQMISVTFIQRQSLASTGSRCRELSRPCYHRESILSSETLTGKTTTIARDQLVGFTGLHHKYLPKSAFGSSTRTKSLRGRSQGIVASRPILALRDFWPGTCVAEGSSDEDG